LAKLSGRLHGSSNHDGSSEGGGGGGGAGNMIHSMFSDVTTTTTSHEGGPKRNTFVSKIYKDAQVLSAALNILRGQAFLSFYCT